MKVGIDREQVRQVAHLARLRLTDSQVDRLRGDLSDILDYMNLLGRVDTRGVEPTAHPLPLRNVLREDRPGASLTPEAALANAPEREQTFFRVPKVLDQGTVGGPPPSEVGE